MVDLGELGSGGNCDAGILDASDVVFAETTTVDMALDNHKTL